MLQPLGDVIPQDRAVLTVEATGRRASFPYLYGTLAIVVTAQKLGATAGDTVSVKVPRFTADRYTLTETGGGDRTERGEWAQRVC